MDNIVETLLLIFNKIYYLPIYLHNLVLNQQNFTAFFPNVGTKIYYLDLMFKELKMRLCDHFNHHLIKFLFLGVLCILIELYFYLPSRAHIHSHDYYCGWAVRSVKMGCADVVGLFRWTTVSCGLHLIPKKISNILIQCPHEGLTHILFARGLVSCSFSLHRPSSCNSFSHVLLSQDLNPRINGTSALQTTFMVFKFPINGREGRHEISHGRHLSSLQKLRMEDIYLPLAWNFTCSNFQQNKIMSVTRQCVIMIKMFFIYSFNK